MWARIAAPRPPQQAVAHCSPAPEPRSPLSPDAAEWVPSHAMASQVQATTGNTPVQLASTSRTGGDGDGSKRCKNASGANQPSRKGLRAGTGGGGSSSSQRKDSFDPWHDSADKRRDHKSASRKPSAGRRHNQNHNQKQNQDQKRRDGARGGSRGRSPTPPTSGAHGATKRAGVCSLANEEQLMQALNLFASGLNSKARRQWKRKAAKSVITLQAHARTALVRWRLARRGLGVRRIFVPIPRPRDCGAATTAQPQPHEATALVGARKAMRRMDCPPPAVATAKLRQATPRVPMPTLHSASDFAATDTTASSPEAVAKQQVNAAKSDFAEFQSVGTRRLNAKASRNDKGRGSVGSENPTTTFAAAESRAKSASVEAHHDDGGSWDIVTPSKKKKKKQLKQSKSQVKGEEPESKHVSADGDSTNDSIKLDDTGASDAGHSEALHSCSTTAGGSDGSAENLTPTSFCFLKVIGKGTFGKVLLVRQKQSGKLYAMKITSKKFLVQNDHVDYMRAERDIMIKINHPFLVGLKCAFQTEAKVYLVMPYVPGGELFGMLREEGLLLEDRARFYAAEMVLALEHLHSLRVIHRDLKPENVLVTAAGHLCLTDFGLAHQWGDRDAEARTSSLCGTTEYMAPEMLLAKSNKTQMGGGKYTQAVDWWSLGALIFHMFTGDPPFTHENQKRLEQKILREKVQIPRWLTGPAHSLLKGLLERNVTKRLGAVKATMFKVGGVTALKQHPFFVGHPLYEDIEWQALLELRVPPPMVPQLANAADTSNFDAEFTTLSPVDSPVLTPYPEGADLFADFAYSAPETPHGTPLLTPQKSSPLSLRRRLSERTLGGNFSLDDC